MYWTALLVLVILWLLGLLLELGGWIHVLPAVASLVFLYRLLLAPRRP